MRARVEIVLVIYIQIITLKIRKWSYMTICEEYNLKEAGNEKSQFFIQLLKTIKHNK